MHIYATIIMKEKMLLISVRVDVRERFEGEKERGK